MPAAINIKPTRMEYLRTMRRIAVSRKGLKLLKLKRSALILEFFNLSKTLADMRSGLQTKLVKGYEGIHATEMFVGPLRLEYESMRIPRIHELTLRSKNVMGVRIPEIEDVQEKHAALWTLQTSTAVSDVSDAFSGVKETIIDTAKREQSLRRLILEIDKVKRRVNALEYILLPKLKKERDYISFRLEEMERDTFSALKHVKKKIESAENEQRLPV